MVNTLVRRWHTLNGALIFKPLLSKGIVLEDVVVAAPALDMRDVRATSTIKDQLMAIATENSGCARTRLISNLTTLDRPAMLIRVRLLYFISVQYPIILVLS